MNTNTMELNMNEMEQVNGGHSIKEGLLRIGYSTYKHLKEYDCEEPFSQLLGSTIGLVKGIYNEIAGEGFTAQ